MIRTYKRRLNHRRRANRWKKQRRRECLFESLESRLLLNADWQNPFNRFDIDDNGIVTAFDVLRQINELNAPEFREEDGSLPVRPPESESPFFDTNGDGSFVPLDILEVINAINGDSTPPIISAGLVTDTAPGNTTNEDRITSNALIAGTASDPTGIASLQVRVDGAAVFDLSPAKDGSFVVDPNDLTGGFPDGEHLLTLTATDPGRRLATFEVRFVLDTTTPIPPSVDLLEASDSGADPADDITNDATPTFLVDAPSGTVVSLLSADVPLLSQPAEDGPEFTAPELADGTYQIRAVVEDLAGNRAESASLTIVIDTLAPDSPTNLRLSAESDTGRDNADGITNDNSPTFTGDGENEAQITLLLDDQAAGSTMSTGVWQITTTELNDAAYLITATATDIAGNISPASDTLNVVIDTAGPELSVGLVNDTAPGGGINDDGITQDLSLSGTILDASQVVRLQGRLQRGAITSALPIGESKRLLERHDEQSSDSDFAHFFIDTGDGQRFAWQDQDPSTPQVIDLYYDFRPAEGFANLITNAQIALAEVALMTWADAVGSTLAFSRNTAVPAEQIINIGVGDLIAFGEFSQPRGTLALGGGVFNHSERRAITSGIVWLDFTETWDEQIGNGDAANTFDFFTVVAHEIGHALGLGHFDDLPEVDLMDSGYHGEQTVLSVNDVEHIQILYGVVAPNIHSTLFDIPFDVDDEAFTLSKAELESITSSPLLDGSYTLLLEVEDEHGQSGQHQLGFTLDTSAPNVSIAPEGVERVAFAAFGVEFTEPISDRALLPESFSLVRDDGSPEGQAVFIADVESIDERTILIVLEEDLVDSAYGFSVSPTISDLAGNAVADELSFDFTVADPTGVSSFSPANGERKVNVTRKTVVRFDEPVDPATIDDDSFYVIANGERVPGRIVVSSTERFATFFYNNPLPPSTEVRVVVDGDRILGRDGLPLDADGDNEPGAVGIADFRTLPLTRIADTNVFGFVRDSYSRHPLVGATIRVDAFPEANAVTDQDGRFELQNMPAPDFFVHVDGSTATHLNVDGVLVEIDSTTTSYPNVGKPFHSIPGQTVQLEMDGQPFDVFLPPMDVGDSRDLSGSAATDVGFGAAGLGALAEQFPQVPPETWDALQVTFPPNSAVDDFGSPATQAAIIPVPPDRIPAPLPPGLTPELVISIQAGGATGFDVPAPIRFPNLEGLSPGEKSLIFSFNHDAGEWQVIGSGTVSENGTTIESDPGVGVLAPGWHVTDRGSQSEGPVFVAREHFPGCDGLGILTDASSFLLSSALLSAAVLGGAALVSPAFVAAAGTAAAAVPPTAFLIGLGLAASWGDIVDEGPSKAAVGGWVGDALGIGGGIIANKVRDAPPVGTVVNSISPYEIAKARRPLFRQYLPKAARFLKFGSAALGAVGSAITARDLAEKIANCKVGLEQNALTSPIETTAISDAVSALTDPLERLSTEVSTAFAPTLSAFDELFSASLQGVLPDEREVFLFPDGKDLRIFELDGSDFIDPRTEAPFKVPFEDLIDDRFLTDEGFRARIVEGFGAGMEGFAEALNPEGGAVRSYSSAVAAIQNEVNGFFGSLADEQPDQPMLYKVTDALTLETLFRGETNALGDLDFVAPAQTALRIQVFDPDTVGYGEVTVISQPSGRIFPVQTIEACGLLARFRIGSTSVARTHANAGTQSRASLACPKIEISNAAQPIITIPDPSGDADGDGLPDFSEDVVGTNPNLADTDFDGITDLAEIQRGLDPLGGRSFPTGIISTLDLRGTAREVVLEGATDQRGDALAFVATGSHGLAIVDAADFADPTILGQLTLPGTNVDVAVDTGLGIAAVAAGSGGLHLVDVSDPMLPTLAQTINFSAAQVEIASGVLYAAAGSTVRSYDVQTGQLLENLLLGGNPVQGMAIEREMLYTMDSGATLRAIDISGPVMLLRDEVQLTHGGGQLLVANGVAYAAAVGTHFRGGFSTADVSDPDNLVEISGPDIVSPNVGPGTAIVPNGSGIGLLVGRNSGVNSLDIMDLSDLAETNDFLTRIVLPGTARRVAIGAGIAFVADDSSGLHVVNYRAFDNQGQPPTVSISTPDLDVDPNKEGIQIVEGEIVPITANVQDDVQVRNVELLVNGTVVRNDVSFPFDFSASLFSESSEQSTASVQVRATDTGGNSALSELLTFELVPDTEAPALLDINPPDGAQVGRFFRSLRLVFSEPVARSILDEGVIEVRETGGAVVQPTDVRLTRIDQVFQLTFDTLPDGDYEIAIDASAISDRVGNPLGDSVLTSTFSVTQATMQWISPGGGFWDDPANWDTGLVPGPQDTVLIDVVGSPTITFRSGDVEVAGLIVNENIDLTGGRLRVTAGGQLDGSLTVDNGTLIIAASATLTGSGTIEIENGAVEVLGTGTIGSLLLSGGELRGAGSLTATANSEWARGKLAIDQLNNEGTLVISQESSLTLSGVLNNSGTINKTADGTLFFTAATLNNLSTGVVDLQTGGTLTGTSGTTNAINNSGIWRKSGGAATTISLPFNNTGSTVDVQFDTLRLARGGAYSGDVTMDVAATALLHHDEGTFSFDGTYRGEGGGDVLFDPGTTIQSAAATFDFTNVNLELESVTIDGNLTNTGILDWTKGNLRAENGALANEGTFVISNGSSQTLTGVVNNSGTINKTADGTLFFTAATLNNLSTGVVDLQTGGTLTETSGTTNAINNSGTWRKSGGAASTISLPFNNTGSTVDVQFDTLRLARGGVYSGDVTMDVVAAALLHHDEGTFSFDGTYRGGGGGDVLFDPGTTIQSAAATFDFTNVKLELESVTIDGNLTNTGSVDWTKGNLRTENGVLFNEGTFVISNGSSQTLTGVVNNSGTINKTADGTLFFTAATINNLSTGVVDLQTGGTLTETSGTTNAINNSGTWRKSGGAATTISLPFNNTGSTVDVQSNTLRLARGGTYSGDVTLDVAATALLHHDEGTFLFDGTYRGGGGGDVLFDFESTIQSAAATFDFVNVNLELESTSIVGDLTNTGSLDWTRGTLRTENGALSNEGTFVISNGSSQTLTGVVNNSGTINKTADGTLFFTAATINNLSNGVVDLQTGGTLTETSGTANAINNSGTFRKSGGATSVVNVSFANDGGLLDARNGTLDFRQALVQTAGTTTLTGGSIKSTAAFELQGGELSGAGTLDADVVSSGEISPGSSFGVLTVDGTFTQSETGSIHIELGGLTAGSEFDQLIVTGAAQLAGTLSVSVDPAFVPSAGASFRVLVYGSRSGQFGDVPVSGMPDGMALQTTYNATDLTLTAADALATSGGAVRAATANLSGGEIASVWQASLNRWSAAGLPTDRLAALHQIEIVTGDLGPALLALAAEDKIWIDDDAAGWGWFVDPTPDDDDEYLWEELSREWVAREEKAASRRIDLLTVVMHEMGHLLGANHVDSQAGDLMSEHLDPGIRRPPNRDVVDRILTDQ